MKTLTYVVLRPKNVQKNQFNSVVGETIHFCLQTSPNRYYKQNLKSLYQLDMETAVKKYNTISNKEMETFL